MPSTKLTNSVVDTARPTNRVYEIETLLYLASAKTRRRSMSDCRNPKGRWPPWRAKEVDYTGLIPFVDTDAAAR